MSSAATWDSSDGWLLTSLLLAGPCRLRTPEGLAELFGVADMLNHAIVTHEELCAVMTRLAATGFVLADGDAVMVAPAARQGLRAIVDASRNVLGAPAKVQTALRTGALAAGPASNAPIALPSHDEFNAGIAAYDAKE